MRSIVIHLTQHRPQCHDIEWQQSGSGRVGGASGCILLPPLQCLSICILISLHDPRRAVSGNMMGTWWGRADMKPVWMPGASPVCYHKCLQGQMEYIVGIFHLYFCIHQPFHWLTWQVYQHCQIHRFPAPIAMQTSHKVENLGKAWEFHVVLSRPGNGWGFALEVGSCL